MGLKTELRKRAQGHRLKGSQQVVLAATVLRMYRKNPKANDFLRHEAERILRRVIYHMRQAAIFEGLAVNCSISPSH